MKTGPQSYLKENALHGTKAFPVGFYTTLVPQHARNMLIHWHEEMEISRLRRGCLLYDVDRSRYEVREGDFLLIAPDTLHAFHQIPGQEASTDSVVFHLSQVGIDTDDGCTRRYVMPLREGNLRLPPVIHPEDPYYGQISECFEALWDCREGSQPCRELRFKAQAFMLLYLLWQLSVGSVQELPARSFRQHEDKLKLELLVRTFFDVLHGWHVQYNVVSRETLLDAQKHPEKHQDLIVRVAGYSAFFNILSPQTQDDIIARTEQQF